MKKKQQKAQLILISIGLFLILLTYYYYPSMNKDKLLKNQSVKEKTEETTHDDPGTTFLDLEYKGQNLEKPFTVKSRSAYIRNDEPQIVHMSDMHLIIYLVDGQIDIYGSSGTFHKLTNDITMTRGPEDPIKVVETPGTTIIYADNLNLLATSSEAEIFNNVSLIDDNGSVVRAHSIKYDFFGKILKVSSLKDKIIKIKIIK